jgi:branched-chain amino acid aminotransferase
MTTLAFRNDNWEEPAYLEPTIEVLTGQGVFETILVTNHVPQFLDLHLVRLRNSSEIMGIATPDCAVVVAGIKQLLLSHQGELGRLRITLYRGIPSPQLMLSLVDIESPSAKVNVNISPWTRNENSAITGAKSASYAENVLALEQAKENGFTETLFFNNAGVLCEAATSNIVIVVDGEAVTPPLNSGCLPGITRQVLLELGAMTEGALDSGTLERASAAALLSSIRGVQPIHVMGERELNSLDETLQHLLAVYRTRVEQDKENWAKLP